MSGGGYEQRLRVVEDPDWRAGPARLIVRADSPLGHAAEWRLDYEASTLLCGSLPADEQVTVEAVPLLEIWMDTGNLSFFGEDGMQATCFRPVEPRTRAECVADGTYPGLVDQKEVPGRRRHRVTDVRRLEDSGSGEPASVVIYQHWSQLLEERRATLNRINRRR